MSTRRSPVLWYRRCATDGDSSAMIGSKSQQQRRTLEVFIRRRQTREAPPGEPARSHEVRSIFVKKKIPGGVYPVASMEKVGSGSSKLCLVRPAGIEPATLSLEG
jgi:hypothetical protein